MPSAYVQIACDGSTLQRMHEALVKQRQALSDSSKTAESACKYLRLVTRENSASSLIVLTRPAMEGGPPPQDEEGDEGNDQSATAATSVSLTPALAPTTAAAAKQNKKNSKANVASGTTTSAAAGAGKGRKRVVMSADDVAALFADDAKTEAKYYILALPLDLLKSIANNLDEVFADLFALWAERPNALTTSCVLEVAIIQGNSAGNNYNPNVPFYYQNRHGNGNRSNSNAAAVSDGSSSSAAGPYAAMVTKALMQTLQHTRDKGMHDMLKYQEAYGGGGGEGGGNSNRAGAPHPPPPPPTLRSPIDGFLVTCFDTEREICDRVLHIGLYFSQFKDAKVRAEVQQHVKRKVDDSNMHQLYTTCLCEVPNVSARRAQVIASTFRTFGQLIEAIRRDDGSFEAALATSREYGESRLVGQGLAAAVKVALTTEYCPDESDPHLAQLQYRVHELFGILPEQQCEYVRQRYGGSTAAATAAGLTTAASATAGTTVALASSTPTDEDGGAARAALGAALAASISSAQKKPRPSAIIEVFELSDGEEDDGDDYSIGNSNSMGLLGGGGGGNSTATSRRPNAGAAFLLAGDDERSNGAIAGLAAGVGRHGPYSDEVRGSGLLFQLSQQQPIDAAPPQSVAAARPPANPYVTPISPTTGGGSYGYGHGSSSYGYGGVASRGAAPPASATTNSTTYQRRQQPHHVQGGGGGRPSDDDAFSDFGLDSLLAMSNSRSLLAATMGGDEGNSNSAASTSMPSSPSYGVVSSSTAALSHRVVGHKSHREEQ